MMRLQNRKLAFGLTLGALVACAVPSFGQDDVSSERPPGDGPTQVEILFYLMDLMRVIDRDETFEADVFVMARWKDPRLAGDHVRVVPTEDVWTPNVLLFNERDISSNLPDVVEIQPDGTVTVRRRLIGTFASPLELSGFPMDTQILEFRFVLYGTHSDEVVLVESPVFPVARSSELAITDWEIGELEMEAGIFRPLPSVTLSSLTVRVHARRLIGYYIVQMLIPLILIVGMSWAVFWIDPKVIPTRMSVCVTTVLTLIAYRFMVGGLVPKLPYLTLVDYLLLGTTLLVAGSFVVVTTGIYLVSRDRVASVARIDRVARIVFPACFVVLVALLGLFG